MAVETDVIGVCADGEEVEFSSEIEVGERAIDRGERLQTAEGRNIHGHAIGREFKNVCASITQHDDVFEAIVLHIAHEHFCVLRFGIVGIWLGIRLENSI